MSHDPEPHGCPHMTIATTPFRHCMDCGERLGMDAATALARAREATAAARQNASKKPVHHRQKQ